MKQRAIQENSTGFIPKASLIERRPPALFASQLALREGNSKKPIYQIHKWWARRLGSVFRSILVSATADSRKHETYAERAFYRKQDFTGMVVLDPFVGGGTSIVEAAKCGASVIGVDIDPVASLVTRVELQQCDFSKLSSAFDAVVKAVKAEILDLYTTRMEDGSLGKIVYAFWVESVTCNCCRRTYEAHPHYQLRRDRSKRRQIVFCRLCHEVHDLSLRRVQFQCTECKAETVIHAGTSAQGKTSCPYCQHEQELPKTVNRKPRHVLFAVQAIDSSGRIHFQRASRFDKLKFARAAKECADRIKKTVFIPAEDIPQEGRVDRRPLSFGYSKYCDLFNSRQLLALSLLAERIAAVEDLPSREFLATAFSDCLASNNLFCYYAFDYQKLTPLFGLHAYHRIIRPVENNVWGTSFGRGSFEKCYKKLVRGKRFGLSPYEFRYDKSGEPARVLTGELLSLAVGNEIPKEKQTRFGVVFNSTSEKLGGIPDRSVDLVLSDPPYYDNLAYSEMSDFYHVWLKRLGLANYAGNGEMSTLVDAALYVKARAGEADGGHVTFTRGLTRVMKECHRVLKDDGLMVFTFHHRTEAAWSALGDALIGADFMVTNVFPVRSEGTSQFHSSEGNLKWDAVFCCRKRAGTPYRVIEGVRESIKVRVIDWRKRLSKLGFAKYDRRNLQRALLTMYRCNGGTYSGEWKQ
jgi:adenine-specific DNA methylase